MITYGYVWVAGGLRVKCGEHPGYKIVQLTSFSYMIIAMFNEQENKDKWLNPRVEVKT